jgi:hypothetical protein
MWYIVAAVTGHYNMIKKTEEFIPSSEFKQNEILKELLHNNNHDYLAT